MTRHVLGKAPEMKGNVHQKDQPRPWWYRYRVFLAGLLLGVGLWVAMALHLPNDTGALEVGSPSPASIQARRSAEYISEVRTASARAQAEARPENFVYAVDFELPSKQRTQLDELLTTITSVHTDPTLSDEEELENLTELSQATGVLSDTLAEMVISLDDEEWNNVRKKTLSLYDRAMERYDYELTEESLKQIREVVLPSWTNYLTQPQRNLVSAFISTFLRVNRVLDEEATQKRKKEAREAVEPVRVNIQTGASIVREGDLITPEIVEQARATGALPRRLNRLSLVGVGVLSGLLSLIFMLYLAFLQKDIIRQPRPLLVITVALIVTAIIARLLQSVWPDQAYAFPLSTTILVLAVVFNLPIALSSAMLLSIVVGVLDNAALSMTVTMMAGSTVAVFAVRGADRSLTFLLAGLGIAAMTTMTQTSFCMFNTGGLCEDEWLTMLIFSGTNGGLSAILSLGLFNIVGNIAGVVTPLKLMELSHPAQPMLRKIIHEAPGTYYHSIAVANLAEAAADVVGADALLLRVGAYYHDIGKTLRPFFFTDNQMGRENVHNDLDPYTSAEIIIDHVREGIKMARSAGLPDQIVDFIATHHGTGLVGHFYQLALRQHDTVNPKDFRYPGPEPWTREQGILMLADSVEATVRAKVQNGKLVASGAAENGQGQKGGNGGNQTLEQLVNGIIDERVRSGQLDNTSLTLRDLVRIRQAFITSLKSIYHRARNTFPRW
ncbi:MAG: HDIG domain-containing protein [Chloroflexaceae bacterium]|nr:HDIG domain-containing protein [Chloroflexaceae bacterium]